MKVMKLIWGAIFATLLLMLSYGEVEVAYAAQYGVHGQQFKVLHVRFEGEINDATASLFEDAINYAATNKFYVVIFEINTPGGSLSAVDRIIKLLLELDPDPPERPAVIIYVGEGGRAVSGGTYILMASHIAAMASRGTVIGSCQPVDQFGNPINESKYIEYVSKRLVACAEARMRNTTAAELFVRKNLNLGPFDALRNHVIEIVADGIFDLLEKLEDIVLVVFDNGTTGVFDADAAPSGHVLRVVRFTGLSDAEVVGYDPGVSYQFVKMLSNPIVVEILLIIGIYAFIFGIMTPGVGAELAGIICIILALIGLGVLGISIGAVILLILGFLLMLAEIKTQMGALLIGGAICLFFGLLLMVPPVGSFGITEGGWMISSEFYRTFLLVAATIVGCFAGLFAFILYKVIQASRIRREFGVESIIGEIGVAKTDITPDVRGIVYVRGEEWTATTRDAFIAKGDKVKVVGVEGLILVVERVKE